jgi:O-antigen/teichoic acid export membrane protein
VRAPQVSQASKRARQFVTTRTVATFLSLIYALGYTAFLGPEKRSVLTFVLASSMIFTVTFTSGLSLFIRSRPKEVINSQIIYPYILLSLCAAILAAVASVSTLLVYANYRTPIPDVLVLLCFLYAFLSCFTLSLLDCLIATGLLRFSMLLDLSMVLIQVFVGVLFVFLNQTSQIVMILFSFLASYSIVAFSILTLLVFLFPITRIDFVLEAKALFLKSRNFNVIGISTGIADRADKLVIGFLLPLEVLGKYALITGILTFNRFLPEAIAKSIFFAKEPDSVNGNAKPSLLKNVLIICAVFCFTLFAWIFVTFSFGDKWGLPFSFAAAFALQELLRARYQINSTKLISAQRDERVISSSRILLVSTLVVLPLFTHYLGVYGPALGLSLIYIGLGFYTKMNQDLKGQK